MRYLVDYMMSRVKTFTVLDWAVLKCYLVSIGVLIGSACAGFFKKVRPLIWLITLGCMCYTIYRLFFVED